MDSIICPFCNGSGCPNCQHTGQLEASPQEIAQLQTLMQAPTPAHSPMAPYTSQSLPPVPSTQKTIPGSRITLFEIKTKTAGLLAFLLLLALFAGAYFSQKIWHSYKPYLAAVFSVAAAAIIYLVGKSTFFQYREPSDFLSETNKLILQKSAAIQ